MKSIWTYSDLLPAIPEAYRVMLGEGHTPLVKSRSIGPALGLPSLYFKLENLNPTGSYKDRFAAVFISLLNSMQQRLCVATSSGNTGAALAAYSAAAGITCALAIVDGAPLPKVRQMQLYGAMAYMVKDFGIDPQVTSGLFEMLERLAAEKGIPLPVSAYRYCEAGMQGVQTIAYELLEEMQQPPAHIFSPAGGGGLTLAVARGVMAYGNKYQLPHLPAVNCVQPEGNNTIAGALRNQELKATAIRSATTAISGLQVPGILDGNEVITACRQLNGNGYVVTDAAVFSWQQQLASREGVFCEPAGAVALAGVEAALKEKKITATDTVVCLVTGSGFKDMAAVEKHFGLPQLQQLDGIKALKEILIQF